MEADELFVETVEDRRRRCDLRATEYDMVQASGLIRRLLIDETPLWHHVNRQYRTRPEFKWVSAWTIRKIDDDRVLVPGLAFDPVIFQFQMDVACSRSPENPDTQVAHSEARKSVRTGSLQDFLRVEVLRRTVPGEAVQTATVRELIKHYANREGGVHFDPRGRSANHYIEQIRDSVGGDLRRTILACGLILIRALEPMAAALTLKDTPGSEGLDFTRIRP